ncbi:GNAT family N-acetyltransferase [Streptomyces sp. NPDC050355]|uniref:GNAT family N-acetyltransferase n=1 Tax=Streptomyces sp. NPDC050355 TaxID=3365609 RepID=UPI003789CFF1
MTAEPVRTWAAGWAVSRSTPPPAERPWGCHLVHSVVGELAAQGQMATLGRAAVVDRVVTQEAHRRRGLGGSVMRTLADHAVAEGATLGWKTHAPPAACVHRP